MDFDFKNPDYLSVFKMRLEALSYFRQNPKDVDKIKVFYSASPADFISDWMVTFDPRKNPSLIPFVLWPKQREFIEWLWAKYQNKADGLVEKCRDGGITYLCCAFAAWLWLFHGGSKVSFGSRKEVYVDKIGDSDSIFEKIRIILRNLPEEFLPAGYSEKTDASFMKVINRENGSTITGEAGDNIGRGGRSGVYFKDESAFYERPEGIEAALSQNSDVKIDVSTPNGTGNPFWQKRFGGKIDVFVFDWRDDPRKDDAWYAKQKETLEPWIVAQEIDRDYTASMEGICIPSEYVRAAIGLTIPASGPYCAGLDVADEGGDSNVLTIRRGPKVLHIEAWKEGDTTQTARRAVQTANDWAVALLNYDSIGVGAGVKGELNSLKGVYTDKGWRFPMVFGVNSGSTDMEGTFSPDRSDKDMFHNLRASMWWRMRRRFERTYETVNGIKTWPKEELISIPNDTELVSELSQPLREITEAGRIKIESKEKMRKRGVKSPNKADALMLAFVNFEALPFEVRTTPVLESTLIHNHVTGKSKTPPWLVQSAFDKACGRGKYIDFEERE